MDAIAFLVFGLFVGCFLYLNNKHIYSDILFRKGMNLDKGSRIEFIKGKPFAIITEKEYVEYIMLKNKEAH